MSTTTRTSSAPQASSPSPGTASWAAVVSRGLGVLAIVTSDLLPASLLPRIAGDLEVPTGADGGGA
ncbi:hypothetical protein [Pseudokineococcus sp. 1T1Z-3]|uniref:hypothetical protein n=1 Tax=Pseudokineococcus sp. 1T1Z-3 TaxID=3132745 RepID=UPI0030A6DED8